MNPSVEQIAVPSLPTGPSRPLKMKRRPGCDRIVRSDWRPTPYARSVGRWLRKRRKQLGDTQREAAIRGQCSNAWICQLETATIDVWSTTIRSLTALCAAYKIEMDVLLKVLRVIK